MRFDCTHYPEVMSQLVSLSENLKILQITASDFGEDENYLLRTRWLCKTENGMSTFDVVAIFPSTARSQKE